MKGSEIIDVDVDPQEARRALWFRIRRFGIPVVGVILILAAMTAIYVHDYYRDRRDVLALSQDVIDTLEERVRTQVERDLGAARNVVNVAAGFTRDLFMEPGREEIEGIALRMMRARREFSNISFGFTNGDFLLVSRSANGTLATKRIEHSKGERTVTWKRRDTDGKVLNIEKDPSDRYDPRVRQWYTGALSAKGAYWTDSYVFFESRALGITISKVARSEAGDVIVVVGLDYSLDSLSRLVAGLHIGKTGIAMIIDERGRLLAFPDTTKVVRVDGDAVEQPRLDQIGDPLLAELYDRLRVSGHARTLMTIDGEAYIVSSSSIASLVGREWSLIFIVPEEDFTGFLAANTRKEAYMAALIVLMIILLTGLLTYQGIQSDRTAQALVRRQRVLDRHRTAFEELASMAATLDLEPEEALHSLTEATVRGLGARRISIWALEAPATSIVCRNCFDQASGTHSSGFRILQAECPGLFDALRAGEEIAVEDAAGDPRTLGLDEAHLNSGGCRSLLSVPIRFRNELKGFVWIEDRRASAERLADARTFAVALANVLAAWLVFASSDTPPPPPPHAAPATSEAVPAAAESALVASKTAAVRSGPPTAMQSASLIDERHERFLAELTRRRLGDGQRGAALFPRVTVLVLRISDDLALAARDSEDNSLFGRVVDAVQQAASARDLPYTKILNETIIAADGFDADPKTAAIALADAALDIRERLRQIFASVRAQSDYTMGVDIGPVLGSSVGRERAAYNLWGGAVRVAATMAATARPGTIQVTEVGFEQLRHRYLLRRRGSFYLEGAGEMATYTLGAAL